MNSKKVIISATVLLLAMSAGAQVLNVKVGNVTYRYPAFQTGVMAYDESSYLDILEKRFVLNEVDEATVTETMDVANTVTVSYGDTLRMITITTEQTAVLEAVLNTASNAELVSSALSGLRLNFQSAGITHVEVESVDGYAIAGNAEQSLEGGQIEITDNQSIITMNAPDGSTFTPGVDYFVTTFPCDLYGGYRLSIFKDGMVAHFFGVHQVAEAGSFISPLDLDESDLEFTDPSEPFVEDERPGLNPATRAALIAYKRNPTEENKQALLEQMGIRYDKVVARKKAKLRQLEREAHHQALIDEMQAIVDEMIENREVRIFQQFLRLIDPREDNDSTDQWMVLRGSWTENAYIAYAPLTNAEYAQYMPGFTYPSGQENFPVVNISYTQALAYCQWLGSTDDVYAYRLPSGEEWIMAAGHMPKDVAMNSDFVESGLTAVDAYAQTTGACGGIDFWGNCWEWTSTEGEDGLYIVKGGAWDSSRDACRTEYSDDVRDPSLGYNNVGFRVVRVDR